MKNLLCILSVTLGLSAYAQTIELVSNINTGGNSAPYITTVYNNDYYFTADDGVHGRELWRTDGTSGGTNMVADINPAGDGDISNLTVLNGILYFQANDGTNGQELWRTDGTNSGTYMVIDLFTGAGGGGAQNLTSSGNLLFFWGNNGNGDGSELFASDGTAAGTVEVKDINAGSGNGMPSFAYTLGYNNHLYFTADDGANGVELWVSDGTNAGTYMLHDLNSGSGNSYCANLIIFNGELYFSANNGSSIELYKSDLTTTFTQLTFVSPPASSPTALTVGGSKLFFSYSDGTNGKELWATDGTLGGTGLVKDINPGTASSFTYSMYFFNGEMFFDADDGVNSTELWKSDGTLSGTVMVKNIHPSSYSLPSYFMQYNNQLFFSAIDGTHGSELWKTDGTNAGTQKVVVPAWATFNDPLAYGIPMQVVDNNLYFSANYDVNGKELYKYWEPLASTASYEVGSLNVYPNPSSGKFQVNDYLQHPGETITKLYGIEGKLLFTEVWEHDATTTKAYDFSALPAGIYFLEVNSGSKKATQKIVIQ